MPAARKVKAEMANIPKGGSELELLIPQKYHDLVEVFSEKELNVLPSHRCTDCN